MTNINKIRNIDFTKALVPYKGVERESIMEVAGQLRNEETFLIDKRRGRLRKLIKAKQEQVRSLLLSLPGQIFPYVNNKRYRVAIRWADFATSGSNISLRRIPQSLSNDTVRLEEYIKEQADVVVFNDIYYAFKEVVSTAKPDTRIFYNRAKHFSGGMINAGTDNTKPFFKLDRYQHPIVSYKNGIYSALKSVNIGEGLPINKEFWEEIEDFKEILARESSHYVCVLVNEYGEESRPSLPTNSTQFNIGEFNELQFLIGLVDDNIFDDSSSDSGFTVNDYNGLLDFYYRLGSIWQVQSEGGLELMRVDKDFNLVSNIENSLSVATFGTDPNLETQRNDDNNTYYCGSINHDNELNIISKSFTGQNDLKYCAVKLFDPNVSIDANKPFPVEWDGVWIRAANRNVKNKSVLAGPNNLSYEDIEDNDDKQLHFFRHNLIQDPRNINMRENIDYIDVAWNAKQKVYAVLTTTSIIEYNSAGEIVSTITLFGGNYIKIAASPTQYAVLDSENRTKFIVSFDDHVHGRIISLSGSPKYNLPITYLDIEYGGSDDFYELWLLGDPTDYNRIINEDEIGISRYGGPDDTDPNSASPNQHYFIDLILKGFKWNGSFWDVFDRYHMFDLNRVSATWYKYSSLGNYLDSSHFPDGRYGILSSNKVTIIGRNILDQTVNLPEGNYISIDFDGKDFVVLNTDENRLVLEQKYDNAIQIEHISVLLDYKNFGPKRNVFNNTGTSSFSGNDAWKNLFPYANLGQGLVRLNQDINLGQYFTYQKIGETYSRLYKANTEISKYINSVSDLLNNSSEIEHWEQITSSQFRNSITGNISNTIYPGNIYRFGDKIAYVRYFYSLYSRNNANTRRWRGLYGWHRRFGHPINDGSWSISDTVKIDVRKRSKNFFGVGYYEYNFAGIFSHFKNQVTITATSTDIPQTLQAGVVSGMRELSDNPPYYAQYNNQLIQLGDDNISAVVANYFLSRNLKPTDDEGNLLNYGVSIAKSNLELAKYIRIYRYDVIKNVYAAVGEVDIDNHFFQDRIAPSYTEGLPSLVSLDYRPAEPRIDAHTFSADGRYITASANRVYISPVGVSHAFIGEITLPCRKIYKIVEVAAGLIVITDTYPFSIYSDNEGKIVRQRYDLHQPCVSEASAVDMGEYCVYASHEGLVRVGGEHSGLLTRGIFNEKQWQEFMPQSIRAERYGRFYVGVFYRTNETQSFIFDPLSQYFSFMDSEIECLYYNFYDGLLYLTKPANSLRAEDPDGEKLYVFNRGDSGGGEWTSGLFNPQGISSVTVAFNDAKYDKDSSDVLVGFYDENGNSLMRRVQTDNEGRLIKDSEGNNIPILLRTSDGKLLVTPQKLTAHAEQGQVYMTVKDIKREIYSVALQLGSNSPDNILFDNFNYSMSMSLPPSKANTQWVKNLMPDRGAVKGADIIAVDDAGTEIEILGTKPVKRTQDGKEIPAQVSIFNNPINNKWYWLDGYDARTSTTSHDPYSRLFFTKKIFDVKNKVILDDYGRATSEEKKKEKVNDNRLYFIDLDNLAKNDEDTSNISDTDRAAQRDEILQGKLVGFQEGLGDKLSLIEIDYKDILDGEKRLRPKVITLPVQNEY